MTGHSFWCCHHFADTRSALLEQVSDLLENDIKVLSKDRLDEILLYSENNCNETANKLINKAKTAFIKLSARFDT